MDFSGKEDTGGGIWAKRNAKNYLFCKQKFCKHDKNHKYSYNLTVHL